MSFNLSVPKVLAGSNLGLELANAFGVCGELFWKRFHSTVILKTQFSPDLKPPERT